MSAVWFLLFTLPIWWCVWVMIREARRQRNHAWSLYLQGWNDAHAGRQYGEGPNGPRFASLSPHRPWFARLRARIFGRSKSVVSGRTSAE